MKNIGAGRLHDNKEKVLLLWEARSLKEISSACESGSLALRNSLPKYLEHLSEALASNRKMDDKSVFAHEVEGSRLGKMHGADRAGNSNYGLAEVISEYHILREVIFQVLETDESMTVGERDIILSSIEQAVNDAVVKFSEVHANIQHQFINTLTHDLKNPIAAAKTNAQIITRKSDVSEGVREAASRIIGNMNRLDSMIHDLLDSGRVRAGEKISLNFMKGDLGEVLAEVVEEMNLVYGKRLVLNSTGKMEGLWGREGLRRMFENLIGNALKYGKADAPITISISREEKDVLIVVHNEGRPIPPADIPMLFETYRRAKSVEEGTKSGWGLGLTVVTGVVEAHNGKVTLESAEGKGTDFIVRLPVRI